MAEHHHVSTINAVQVTGSFKGLPEPPAVGYLGERLALLSTLAVGMRWIAEWENSQDIQVIRDAQERFDLVQSLKAHPIRADPF